MEAPPYNNGTFCALITARGGPEDKNLLLLAGKPLIAWTIQAALAASSIDRVIVSTDCEETAAICREHGAEVPFMRPALETHLEAVRHAVETLAKENYFPQYLVVLQPTSPYRGAAHIDAATKLMLEKKCGSVTAVTKMMIPLKDYVVNEEDGALERLNIANDSVLKVLHKCEYPRRQDLPNSYLENGSIYIQRSQDILSAPSGDFPWRSHCRFGEVKMGWG